jgi:hypothetical protein
MRTSSLVRFALTTLLTMLLSALALAQPSRQTGPARETITREIGGRTLIIELPLLLPLTEANFEQYRNDLLAIMAVQKETAKLLRSQLAAELLEAGIAQVHKLTYADYTKNNSPGFPELGILKDAVTQHHIALAQALADGRMRLSNYTIPTDAFPDAQYATNLCPLNPQPPEVVYTSGFLLIAAETALNISKDACQQIISGLAAGSNYSLACIPQTVIYLGIKIAHYFIDFCDRDTTAGQVKGIFMRAEYLKDQLNYSRDRANAHKAALSTQLTNAENHIVTNDNNNKAALSTQTDAFKTQALRTAIERNLAADPAAVAGIGFFQLPASRGGYLELARQLVIDTYNAQLAIAGAGVVIYDPSSDLSQGATFTAQGKYREAYYYYRKAFRSIVKFP